MDWIAHSPGLTPNGTVLVSEMRPRLKVADKIEAAMKANAEAIDLEDAEFEVLRGCSDRIGYSGVNRDAVAAADTLANSVRAT